MYHLNSIRHRHRVHIISMVLALIVYESLMAPPTNFICRGKYLSRLDGWFIHPTCLLFSVCLLDWCFIYILTQVSVIYLLHQLELSYRQLGNSESKQLFYLHIITPRIQNRVFYVHTQQPVLLFFVIVYLCNLICS